MANSSAISTHFWEEQMMHLRKFFMQLLGHNLGSSTVCIEASSKKVLVPRIEEMHLIPSTLFGEA